MRIRNIIAAGAVALTAIMPMSTARADERTLYAKAAAESWGPQQWEQFRRWVEYHDFVTWVDSVVTPTGDLWDRVARCETGGNWAMTGSRYSGGVGFANSTWSAYRYDWMPTNAGQANREEQIIVAERVRWELRPHGSLRGKWGCGPAVGAP